METLSTKVPNDLSEEIEQYREEYDLNRSQAIRRLLEDGLEHEEQPQGIVITKPAAVALIGWFLIAVDWIEIAPSQPAGWLGVALLVTAGVYAGIQGRL